MIAGKVNQSTVLYLVSYINLYYPWQGSTLSTSALPCWKKLDLHPLTWSRNSGEPSQEPTGSAFSLPNIDKLDQPQTFWSYIDLGVKGKPKGWRIVECMQVTASASVIKTDDLLNSTSKATVVNVSHHQRMISIATYQVVSDRRL